MNKKVITALFSSLLLVTQISFAQVTDDTPSGVDINYCPRLVSTFQRGATDNTTNGQVTELQKFFEDYFDVKLVSGIFGRVTQGYVMRFQKENNLPAYGLVGFLTRSKIANVCSNGTTPVVPIKEPIYPYTDGKLSVSISGINQSYPLGTKMDFSIIKNNIPTNSGLVLSLVLDVSSQDQWTYRNNITGPLMLRPKSISGTGSETFSWDGKSVGCAQTDSPMWCKNVKAGRYYIQATVFDKSNFSILGWPDRTTRNKIAEYKTNSFYLTGATDLEP
jgi:peptidoglycan hydrolase-like protein with peptidoglycan-binding domain